MSSLLLNNVSKTYYTRRVFTPSTAHEVLSDLSFEVKPGERVALVGPNGSGKSTTIKILSGIIQPTIGVVSVAGITPWRHRSQVAKILGVLLGHCSQLWPNGSVEEALQYASAVHGLTTTEYHARVSTLGESLDIHPLLKKKVTKLSSGERMKCEIALGFLHDPKIMLLDEPSIGLDFNAKRVFRELLTTVAINSNKTILLTSHDMNDIEPICQRVLILSQGKLVYHGAITDLKRKFAKFKVIKIIAERLPESLNILGCEISTTGENMINITLDLEKNSIANCIADIAKKISFSDIAIESKSLESIIERVYHENSGEL
ncbi:ATP-binding cassette domain-containing protein [unidentified bacterial endosymbiont]|uniref:ATP-binding cassette domain-containing protein n=1 Tax=unidentified bacterial endosymbiont TaxID=2355 RepID=UPI0026466111|nr:ATP-binding cassette domain-containing protein [unidentified bacterial endosymbiont]